mmetsp:Transcript_4138/g.10458  ORF Transcript_4138/g.10458 Transcript_4138/m.10458 type:complete len:374 (+) Transcript_4138:666-1787(+)
MLLEMQHRAAEQRMAPSVLAAAGAFPMANDPTQWRYVPARSAAAAMVEPLRELVLPEPSVAAAPADASMVDEVFGSGLLDASCTPSIDEAAAAALSPPDSSCMMMEPGADSDVTEAELSANEDLLVEFAAQGYDVAPGPVDDDNFRGESCNAVGTMARAMAPPTTPPPSVFAGPGPRSPSWLPRAAARNPLGRQSATGCGASRSRAGGRRAPGRSRSQRRRDDPQTAVTMFSLTVTPQQSNARLRDVRLYDNRNADGGCQVALDRVLTAPAGAAIPLLGARWRHSNGTYTIATFVPHRMPRRPTARVLIEDRVTGLGAGDAEGAWQQLVDSFAPDDRGAELHAGAAIEWAYASVVRGVGIGCLWMWRRQPPSP